MLKKNLLNCTAVIINNFSCRAKRRDQFERRILSGARPSNDAQPPTGTHFNHSKIPKFINHSHLPTNSLKNWVSLVSGASNNENIPSHHKYSKLNRKLPGFGIYGKQGTSVRWESHPQKTKGSTGKIIQRDRNEAAILKLNTALYGMERD